MLLAFDLDGCLVDTAEANRLAYLAAGVVIPPEARYLPALLWDCPAGAKTAKLKHYGKYLVEHAHKLPSMELFVKYGGHILTGASYQSVEIVAKQFPEILRAISLNTGMTPKDKTTWLLTNGPGAYFDDDAEFVKKVNKGTLWTGIDVNVFWSPRPASHNDLLMQGT